VTVRITTLAATESGKGEYVKRCWWPRVSRLLILDHVGEFYDAPPGGAVPVLGASATIDALKRLSSHKRWRISASVTVDEISEEIVPRLFRYPEIRQSYGRLVGGLALHIAEVDRVIGSASTDMRDLWRRSRHAGLTVFADSQRPSNVSKEITSQSDAVVFLHIHEPADVEYMQKLVRSPVKSDAILNWLAGERYRSAAFLPRSGRVVLQHPAP
jgi:DNA helicase HerA-like ATPase